MKLTPIDWHKRFQQQARWSRVLRHYLYERAGLQAAQRVLDVGCGTGVLIEELQSFTQGQIYAIDINLSYLHMVSAKAYVNVNPLQGDAHRLPYKNSIFDITFCHFVLMWLSNPRQAILEMARVTSPGGYILALAEPDYGGRIDYPHELETMGRWQQDALRNQGADPLMGRKLASFFNQAGLDNVEWGVLGGQWQNNFNELDWEMEWSILQSDLESMGIKQNLTNIQSLDLSAFQKGERILYVPTFYSWGRKPN